MSGLSDIYSFSEGVKIRIGVQQVRRYCLLGQVPVPGIRHQTIRFRERNIMYNISLEKDTPDIEYAVRRIRDSVEKGISISGDESTLMKLEEMCREIENNLYQTCGIMNPNNQADIIRFYDRISDGLSGFEKDTANFVYGPPDNNPARFLFRNGKWTTDKEALMGLSEAGYQSASEILEYRKIKNYCHVWRSFLEARDKDGRIHPRITVSKTNRINYSSPPLINIPRDLPGSLIQSRRKGNLLFSADIKQQEPAIMVHMLGLKELREFIKVHKDLYAGIFIEVFGRNPKPTERDEVKKIWNAMTYGASLKRIKNMCRYTDGDRIGKYFNSMWEFKKYRRKCMELADQGVRSMKTYFGTVVYACENGPRLWRVLMDIAIQGTGSDIMALLIKHFDEEVSKRGLMEVMDIYYVRCDEIILEIQREFAEENGTDMVNKLIKDLLEHQIDDWEPFLMEINQM